MHVCACAVGGKTWPECSNAYPLARCATTCDSRFSAPRQVLGLYKPLVWEYARLNITNNLLSKRRLARLVADGHVSGWDDPRLLTLAGLRRRGVAPEVTSKWCMFLYFLRCRTKERASVSNGMPAPATLAARVAGDSMISDRVVLRRRSSAMCVRA